MNLINEDEEIQDHMLRESDIIYVAETPTDLPENTIMSFITLGNDLLIQVWMKDDNSINDLKEKIASVYKIPVKNQDIYWKTQLQEDEKTIDSCVLDQKYAFFDLRLIGDLKITIIDDSKEISQSFDANSTIDDVKKVLFKPNKIKKESNLAFEGIVCNDLDALFGFNRTAHYFEIASDQGDPIACCNYGLLLAKGAGVTKDEKIAIKYMRKGVSSNFTEAIYDCGVFLDKTKGEGKAIDESRRLLKLASDAGHLMATNNLGLSFIQNDPKDVEKGLDYIKIAADNGVVDACANFAFFKFNQRILKAEDEIDINNYVDDIDFKSVAFYAKKAAENDNVDAQSLYGSLLVNGLGVGLNKSEAANYFKKAADSMYNHDMMLLKKMRIWLQSI